MSIDNYGNIQQVRFWCQKVLPLVYDDSLSYYEVLCKLTNQLNLLIDNYNGFVSEINDDIEAIVAEELDQYVSRLIGEFKSFPLTNLQKRMREGYTGDPFTICCVGTSITWGQDGSVTSSATQVAAANRYPNILASNLSNFFDWGRSAQDIQDNPEFPVVTVADTGATSRDIADWKNTILALEPSLIILEIGVGDARRGIPFSETAGHILEFAEWAKENDIDICLMNGMPVYGSTDGTPTGALGPGWGRKVFNKNMRDLANSSGLFLIDIEEMMNTIYQDTRFNEINYQPDGAHLTNYSYIAYAVSDQLFNTAYQCEGKGMQFHAVAITGSRRFSGGNIATGTPSAFGGYIRIDKNSENAAFRAHTSGYRYFRTGVVLGCNRFGGKVRLYFNGTSYTFDTFLSGVGISNTVEKIFWFDENRAPYNVITLRDIQTPDNYAESSGPYAYISAIVTKELDTIPAGSNITEAS